MPTRDRSFHQSQGERQGQRKSKPVMMPLTASDICTMREAGDNHEITSKLSNEQVTVSAMVSCVHCTEHLIQQLQTLQPLRQQTEGKVIYDVRRQEYAASNQAVMVIVCALCPLAT